MNKAIEELKNYAIWKVSLETIPERLAEIEDRMLKLGGGSFDAPVKSGGGNKREEMLVNCITEKEELLKTLERNKARKEYIEKGLSVLNKDEREILETFYVSNLRHNEAKEKLVTEMGYAETSIERIRSTALRKYSLAGFGK